MVAPAGPSLPQRRTRSQPAQRPGLQQLPCRLRQVRLPDHRHRGTELTGNDFGNWQPATKSGYKFNDLNANHVADNLNGAGRRRAGPQRLDDQDLRCHQTTVVQTAVTANQHGRPPRLLPVPRSGSRRLRGLRDPPRSPGPRPSRPGAGRPAPTRGPSAGPSPSSRARTTPTTTSATTRRCPSRPPRAATVQRPQRQPRRRQPERRRRARPGLNGWTIKIYDATRPPWSRPPHRQ